MYFFIRTVIYYDNFDFYDINLKPLKAQRS